MNRLIALFLLLPAWNHAQETAAQPVEAPPAKSFTDSHWNIDLSAGTQLQSQQYLEDLYHGADAQLGYTFNRNWKAIGQSFLTFTDPAQDRWENRQGDQADADYLRFNQSSFTVVRRMFSNEYRTKRMKARSINSGFSRTVDWGLRFGYFYSQQSWASDPDYYEYSAVTPGQPIYVTGYRGHSGTLGMDYAMQTNRSKSTTVHHFYADLLVGFNLSVASVYHDAAVERHYHNYDLSENFDRDLLGTRVGYQYKRYGKGHFGFLAGTEFQMKPIVQYQRVTMYPVRGGEGLTPFAFTAKLGITYRL